MSAYQQVDEVYYPNAGESTSAPPQEAGYGPTPQSYGSAPTSGQEGFGLTWVEPSEKSPVVAALLGLLGLLPIPLLGFGHLYLGQRGKFFWYLTMGLASLLPLLGVFIPGVNAIILLVTVIVKISLTVLAIIDAYNMGTRLQEGKPIAAGECCFFALPLGKFFIKEPVFVSEAENSPAEYKVRLGINA